MSNIEEVLIHALARAHKTSGLLDDEGARVFEDELVAIIKKDREMMAEQLDKTLKDIEDLMQNTQRTTRK
jgi:hypothetical protein